MAELISFEIVEFQACRIIGKETAADLTCENPIPALWERCFIDGTFDALERLHEYHDFRNFPGVRSAYAGWTGPVQNGVFPYICGMIMKRDCPVPDGFAFRDLTAGTVAAVQLRGSLPDLYGQPPDPILSRIERAGFRAGGFSLELYTAQRFAAPDPQGQVILDYYWEISPER